MASTSDRAAAANATRRRLSVGAAAVGAPGGVLANVSEGGAPGISAGDAPILSEWFLKRGKLKKKLKNRLFLLYPDRIEYKKRASGTAQGKIWLSTILEVCCARGVQKDPLSPHVGPDDVPPALPRAHEQHKLTTTHTRAP
jgi:hypothetical protein